MSNTAQSDALQALRDRHLEEERLLLIAAIEATGGQLRATAARLGCGVSSLQRALTRHDELRRAVRTRVQYVTQLSTQSRTPVRTKRPSGKATGQIVKHKNKQK